MSAGGRTVTDGLGQRGGTAEAWRDTSGTPFANVRPVQSATLGDVFRNRRSILDPGARVFAWLTFGTLTFTSAGFQIAGGVALADVALFATVVCCLGAFDATRFSFDRSLLALLVGALAVLFGGSLGALVSGRPTAWLDMVAFVAVVGLAIGFASSATPASRASGFLEPRLALIAGGSFGVVWGLVTGPTEFASRVSGLTVHPNSFGFAAFLTAAVSISVLLDVGGTRGRLGDLGMVMGVAIGTAGCAQSGSRAALGALLIVFGLAGIVSLRRKPRATLLGLAATVVVALATADRWSGSVGIARLVGSDSSASRSDAVRSASREASFELIDRWPVTGSGFGQALRAHSLPIQLWQVAGVLGLTAFAIWVWLLVFVPVRTVLFGRLRPFPARLLLGPAIAAWAVVSNALWELEPWVAIVLATAGTTTSGALRAPVAPVHSLVDRA